MVVDIQIKILEVSKVLVKFQFVKVVNGKVNFGKKVVFQSQGKKIGVFEKKFLLVFLIDIFFFSRLGLGVVCYFLIFGKEFFFQDFVQYYRVSYGRLNFVGLYIIILDNEGWVIIYVLEFLSLFIFLYFIVFVELVYDFLQKLLIKKFIIFLQ